MRATTWVPAGAAVVLVVGVLAARGGTAVAVEDLVPAARPTATSPAQVEDARVVLEADGVPLARLGSSGGGLRTGLPGAGEPTAEADPPAGCVLAWSDYADAAVEEYDMAVWLVDGRVSSVVLTRWDPTTAELSGLGTWLGPTIGSPVATASALPGARTTTARPFGPTGPAVTVVHVLGDGIDVVFSDAAQDLDGRPDAAAGRITTVEVRHPRARGCSVEAVVAAGAAAGAGADLGADLGADDLDRPAADLVLGPDGLTVLPLGTPESAVLATPGLRASPDLGRGCRSYSVTAAGGGRVRLVAVDDVVVQALAVGPVRSVLGVADGGSWADVLRAFPELAPQGDGNRAGSTHEVVTAARVLRVELRRAVHWVPDVDVPVRGGPPVVRTLSVRDAAVPASRLC